MRQISIAAEMFEYNQTIRSLGMGGVYVFHDEDAPSILQNPGYLCQTRGMNWTLYNIGGGINSISDIQNYSNPNFTGLSSFSSFYGKNIWLGLGGYMAMTFPCFGLGAYSSGFTGFRLNNPSFPGLDMSLQNDYAILGGFGIPIGPFFSFGLNVKRVTRMGGSQVLGPDILNEVSSSSSLLTSFTNEGNGYGADLGFVARAASVPFKPTLSLGWKDVGSTAFIKSKGDRTPPRIKDNLVAGMTFQGDIPLLGIAGGVEYRNITTQGEQLGQKLHMGLEVSILMIDLRAGLNQGYTTYGVGLDMWLFAIDAAYYGVEKGYYPGQTKDERVQIGIHTELSFDPNFNLTGVGGKGRKLKQRR